MKYIGLVSSDARGKNGGNVASRNRFGTYLRRHVSGVQPRSASQQSNRQTFGAISGAWRGLSAAQQQGWNTLATTITFKNTLGAAYSPTGAQLFMLFSRNLIRQGGTTYAAAPTNLPTIPPLTSITPTFSYGFSTASVTLTNGGTGYPTTGTFSVAWSTGTGAGGTYTATAGVITALTQTFFGSGQTGTATVTFSGAGTGAAATATLGTTVTVELNVAFTPTPVPAGCSLFFYATKPQSKGLSFTSKSTSRFIQAALTGATSAASLGANYGKIVGQSPTHGRLQVRAHLIDNATGYPGPDQVAAVEW